MMIKLDQITYITTYHFFSTIVSALVSVCAEISFFRSPMVSELLWPR